MTKKAIDRDKEGSDKPKRKGLHPFLTILEKDMNNSLVDQRLEIAINLTGLIDEEE